MNLKSLCEWLLHKSQLIKDAILYLSSLDVVKTSAATIVDYILQEIKELSQKVQFSLRSFTANPQCYQPQFAEIYQKRIEALKEQLSLLRREKSQLQEFHQCQIQRLREVEADIVQIRKDEGSRFERQNSLSEQIVRLKCALQNAQFQIEDLKNSILHDQQIIDMGRQKTTSLEKRIANANQEIRRMKSAAGIELIQFAQQLEKAKNHYEMALSESEVDNRNLSMLLARTNERVAEVSQQHLSQIEYCKELQLRLAELNQDLVKANTHIQGLTKELGREFESRNAADSRLLESQQCILELKKKLLIIEEEKQETQFMNEGSRSELRKVEKQLDRCKQQLAKVEQEDQTIRQQNQRFKEELHSIRGEVRKGMAQLKFLSEQLLEQQNKAKRAEDNYKKQHSQCVEEYNRQIQTLLAMLSEASRRAQASQQQLSQQSQVKEEETSAFQEALARVARLTSEKQKLRSELSKSNEKYVNLLADNQKHKRQLEAERELNESLISKLAHCEKLQEEVQRKQAQLYAAGEQRRRLAGSLEDKSRELQKQKEEVQFWKDQVKRESLIFEEQRKKIEFGARQLIEKSRIQIQTLKVQLKRTSAARLEQQAHLREQIQRLQLREIEMQALFERRKGLQQLGRRMGFD